jgi:hypothetical protein
MQFIETARLLEEHTLACCVKAPRRYSEFLTKDIMSLAGAVHSYVIMANSIYVTNRLEYETRRDYFNRANAALQALNPKLSLLYGTLQKSEEKYQWIHNAMKRWGELMVDEAKLIGAVKKSDHDRYSKTFT